LQLDDKFRCPGCGGLDIRYSRRRGPVGALMFLFNRTPFRCRACEKRFYAMHPHPPDTEETADQKAG
jgi:hypothetical protein